MKNMEDIKDIKGVKSRVENLLKNNNTVLMSTENGVLCFGDLATLLYCYEQLTRKIIEGGIKKDYLDLAYKLGTANQEEQAEIMVKAILDTFGEREDGNDDE